MITPEEKNRQRIKLFIIILISALALLSAVIFISNKGEKSSITVEFTTRILDDQDEDNLQDEKYLVAGKDALITFRLIDNSTGQPISGLNPQIAFSSSETGESVAEHRHFRTSAFLERELSLPKIQLFVLNSMKGTIAVQGTSEVIRLKGTRVSDMVAGRFGDYVYAALMNESQVAVVDAISHEVIKYIDVGAMPGGMFLQPESKYLWVSNDGSGSVSIIDTDNNILTRTIETGKGYHQIAFSPENAYITNSGNDTVTVIRLFDLTRQRDIEVRRAPYGIGYSNVSDDVYVANILEGTVTLIEAGTNKIKGHIPLSKGVEIIRFSPDGRLGVVLNQHANIAYLIDSVSASLIKTVKTGEAPNDIVFMNGYALVRDTYSPDLTYISLDQETSNYAAVGSIPSLTRMPHSLITTPSGDEVVVTSPGEGRIWFIHDMYDEDAKFLRPMTKGSAKVEYGSDALAVVESKLHEIDPGVYAQYIKLDRTGTYDIVFRTEKKTPYSIPYLNTGTVWINTSFKIEVLPDQITVPSGRPSTSQYNITNRKKGDTIFTVDDSGGANYSSIQDAIDNALSGDTILVYSGTYHENVNVNKQLILRGVDNGGGNPVVEAGRRGSAITLSEGGSTLEGFIATGSDGAGISVSSDNNIIQNNNASINNIGIDIYSSGNNMISGNTAYNNNMGISVYSSRSNILRGNDASNNLFGIWISYSGSNTLSNNIMTENKYNFGIDVSNEDFYYDNSIDTSNTVNGRPIYYLRDVSDKVFAADKNASTFYCINCNNITVRDATLENNAYGVFFWKTINSNVENINASNNMWGISLYSSGNNTVSGSTLNSNEREGIFLSYSGNNMVSDSSVSGNSFGIRLSYSSNSALNGNIATNNAGHGITLSFSSNNTLSSNEASNNGKGISLWSSSNNTLRGNTVKSNRWDGISLYSSRNVVLDLGGRIIGTYLYPSGNNMLKGNYAHLNGWEGISSAYSSGNNTLNGNNDSDNYCMSYLFISSGSCIR